MTQPHTQHDNMLIAAEDKDALFECEELLFVDNQDIAGVLKYPSFNWKHVKPVYKYQHVKDAWEADKSLVVQCSSEGANNWTHAAPPIWSEWLEYRIKPKTVTMRLYANLKTGMAAFMSCPDGCYTIPINGTETEVEVE